MFAGISGQISGFSKLKRELDRLSGVTGWRLHDCRRTLATGCQDIGVDGAVIRSILNHASAEGVSSVYMRSQLLTQKRTALELWCTELSRIVKVDNSLTG